MKIVNFEIFRIVNVDGEWRQESVAGKSETFSFDFLKTLEKETRKPYHRSNNMCNSNDPD